MDYTRNEDKLCTGSSTGAKYNHIYLVDDISNESGEVTEPVTLQEMKDYLRLEGFSSDATNIQSEAPLSKTLLEGATTIQDNLLIDATILTLARGGIIYTKSLTVGNRKFTHNQTTGVIAFQTAGEVGGEGIDITYGYASETGGDDAFDFDNDLIEELITEGRMWVESYTGLNLIPKTLQVTLINQAGMTELPGPVTGTVVIKDADGNTIDSSSYKFIGSQFPKLETTFDGKLTIEYDAGYTSALIPKGLKNAIKAYVADHYEFRGDNKPEAPNERAAQKARPHKRVSPWG